jgi:glycerophosphoryl diester phosphodiesterase
MLIFGHRGSPRRFRENTLESFEEALRGGADGFETDLRFLSDQVAVLYHDDELDESEIESLTSGYFAEKGMQVHRVCDLAAFAPRTSMMLEVKRSQWEDALLGEIESWPNVIVTSFDHRLVAELSRRNVSFARGIVYYGRIVDGAGYAQRIGATWACPNYHFVDKGLVDDMHAHGVKVMPWTPNRVREWEALRAAGCDGIITDLPAEAVAWRGGSSK